MALEDANRFAKLFLEDIRNAQPVEPPGGPKEPVKPIVLPKPEPKPEPVIEPEPETVKVRGNVGPSAVKNKRGSQKRWPRSEGIFRPMVDY